MESFYSMMDMLDKRSAADNFLPDGIVKVPSHVKYAFGTRVSSWM